MKAGSRSKRFTVSDLNKMDQESFTRAVGPVFEHSPWVAERTWAKRAFASFGALHGALCETLAGAVERKKLELIRAHPDLVGRAALASSLTAASTHEQASAGLNRLTRDEVALFRQYNRAYRKKFGFPFVICARLNKKAAILKGFDTRLKHSRAQEIRAALEEVGKIARLRLEDIIQT